MKCKFCNEKNFTKNGKVRYLQRFLCKSCGKTFVEGDKRGSPMTEARKSIAIVMYSQCKVSIRAIAKFLNINHSIVYRWIKEVGKIMPEPVVSDKIREIEIDEMWHFVKKKTIKPGYLKPLIEIQKRLLPGLLENVISLL